MAELKNAKYIVTNLRAPENTPDYNARYKKFANRILWMDDNVVPGAFQMNCSWYLKPNADLNMFNEPHKHDEREIIGFFSSDPDKPNDLGAEIEFWLEDEKYMITKSALIFVPGGMKHCPLILRRVDRPVFHFSVLTSGKYEMK